MLNIEDFVQRMQLLMDYYNISASAFADKLTVQRSSLSHLMSGRNKPSLEFVMRITEAYPEADLYWLLYGKGEFPKSSLQSQSQSSESGQSQSQFAENPTPAPELKTVTVTETSPEPDLFSSGESVPESQQSQSQFTAPSPELPTATVTENSSATPLKTENETENSEIERIVIFYKDGRFKDYVPGR